MLYDSIFENLEQKIFYSFSAFDGYEFYKKHNVDIIITDFDMQEMNGLDMIEKIRAQDPHIPIILASAIEDLDVMIRALQLKVSHFIKKPLNALEVLEVLETTSKTLLANRYVDAQKELKIKTLEAKDKYSAYQEDLAFAKELNILRNDFYYQMIISKYTSLVDFMYKPLDVMSGDAYSARRIDTHTTFYLIVDGMGKGLSASLSAMIMASFVNHIVDKMLFLDSFDFGILIHETMEYIKPILLEEEALSIDYILMDEEVHSLQYAKFGMPVMLLEDSEHKVIRLRSNNPPMSKYTPTFNVDNYYIEDIQKFLFYTDGLVENSTDDENITYNDYLEQDFIDAFTREELKKKMFDRFGHQEDDVTLIFIHRFKLEDAEIHKYFPSKLEAQDEALEWYEAIWSEFCNDETLKEQAAIVFSELFMNAYEHGNLGLTSALKHYHIEHDSYIDTLTELEATCQKQIEVTMQKIEHKGKLYIVTNITDEGEGFDTQILSEIFRNAEKFNGRGVYVSRQGSLGIYYSPKGNSVLFLHQIDLKK